MRWKVDVSEMLQRIVDIEAGTREEAIDKVRLLYRGGEIVLSADDFVGVEFNAKRVRGNKGRPEKR